ncbi:BCAS1 protein, partial [Grantiella picta]|nr:BCAS1 protein [Grantiella picta]
SRDNAAVSSPRTKAQSPAGPAGRQSPGTAASTALPAARPRSLLAFPWAVPAREEPAAAPARPEASQDGGEVSELSTVPKEDTPAGPQRGSHDSLGQDVELAGTAEGQHVATPAKPVTLLDRIFRLEKGKDRSSARGDPQEPDVPNGSIAARAASGEIDECKQKDLGQDSAGVQGVAAAAPGRAEAEQDRPQAAAGHSSVMSFLKTLVSPSKTEAKSDSEDKGSKGHGGQPGPKAAPESPSKGTKKKKAESPKLGHSTFSKLFRHKAAKETQQTPNTKSPEQPPAPCVKADRSVPPSQEPPAKQNPKAPEAAAPLQGVTPETPREATKDKGSATPLPLSKLFWKKNSSEEEEAVGNEKAEVTPEAVAPDRDESKSAEPSEVKPRGAESKTPKANLRKFFKLTLNAVEKPLAPSDSDPGGLRSKESSKDKKSTLELGKQKVGKQESREQLDPRDQQDADSIHNGGDAAKETSYKRAEKRQSLGGFFKGL